MRYQQGMANLESLLIFICFLTTVGLAWVAFPMRWTEQRIVEAIQVADQQNSFFDHPDNQLIEELLKTHANQSVKMITINWQKESGSITLLLQYQIESPLLFRYALIRHVEEKFVFEPSIRTLS